jgi:hypothetical protein
MNDTLSVDLVIEDSAVDRTKAKLNALPAAVSPAAKATGDVFSKALSTAEIKALDLHANLRRLSEQTIGTRGVDGLGLAAQRTAAHVRDVYTRLREIEAETGKTSNPLMLRGLETEAQRLNTELDQVLNKVQRVSAGRAAAADRQAATGGGGFGKYAGLAGAASSFLPPELAAGANVAEAASAAGIVTTGSLAVFGALAAAGAIVVHISQDIRTEAERRLAVEERVQGAINKQIIAQKESLAESQKLSKEAADRYNLDKRLDAYKTYSDDAVKNRIELLKKLQSLSTNPGQYDPEILGLENIRRRRPDEKAAADAKSFEDRNESAKRSQEDFNKSVEKGVEKVRDLSKSWTSAFDSLYQRANADNPFALFLQKSATESDKLKESLRGLPPELQKLAFAMKAVADGKDLFKLRIDSAVDAAGLRDDAEAFRNPGLPGRTPEQQKSRVEQKFFSAIQPGGYFGYNAVNPNAFTDEQKRQIAANTAYGEIMSDPRFAAFPLSQKGVARAAYKSYFDKDNDSGESFGEGRLAAQIAALEKFHPKTAGEQSEFDRKIIALTQGVDPLKLDDHTRTLAADARLHEASRQEQAEKDAEKNRKEDNDIRKKLADAVNKLADVANKEGVAGVDKKLEVTLKDETGGRATATTATPADVDLNYGTFSGSGGMTSY